jgi:hypothetical protein
MAIELVESFDKLGRGKGGGYWEDEGYAWYAGIYVSGLMRKKP